MMHRPTPDRLVTFSSQLRWFMLGAMACTGQPALDDLPPLPERVNEVHTTTRGEIRPLREMILAVSGDTRAEIEPCGCKTVSYGGFRRRWQALQALETKGGPPVFVLDAGNMLVRGVPLPAEPERRKRADLILDLSRAMSLDAWCPSPLDMEGETRVGMRGSGAVSATLPGFDGGTVLVRKGTTLGVVGLSAGPKVEDAVVAVTRTIGAIEAASGAPDAWVLLSNAPQDVTAGVLAAASQIGAALALEGPEEIDPANPIVTLPERGRYLTTVHVALASTPTRWVFDASPVASSLRDARQRCEHLTDGPARTSACATVISDRDRLGIDVAGRNVAEVIQQPLGREFDLAGPLDALIARYKGERQQDAAATAASEGSGPRFATAGPCLRCHEDRFLNWVPSSHAKAIEPLQRDHHELDVECVSCHTTGYGQPGGYSELTQSSLRTWSGVQCEACHGPLNGHPENPNVRPHPVGKATCIGCHDEANSPDFDYSTYVKKISCYYLSNTAPANALPSPSTVPSPP